MDREAQGGARLAPDPALVRVKRVATGLAFVAYPLMSGVAFLAHPNLVSLEVTRDVTAKIDEFHNNPLMHFGHFMMVLAVPPLIAAIVRLMTMPTGRDAWLGFVGGVMAVSGAVVLVIQKTALCLVMSAFDMVPSDAYAGLLPGIEALFDLEGYLAIVYLLPLLPLGVLVQAVGLYRSVAVPRWQSVAMILAMVGLGVAAAVDIDLFGLVATVMLAVAWFPLGLKLIAAETRPMRADC